MKAILNVAKKFTINTGNYSSVQPSVSLTVHDVPMDKIQEVHKHLDIIADGLVHEQIESDAMTMGTMKKLGIGEYFSKIDKDQMKQVIEASIKNVIEVNRSNENEQF
jgi:signal transduction histidine kinase